MDKEQVIAYIKNCYGDCSECLTNWKDCPKSHRKEILQVIETLEEQAIKKFGTMLIKKCTLDETQKAQAKFPNMFNSGYELGIDKLKQIIEWTTEEFINAITQQRL